jgi:hypothetical protein
MTPSKYGYIQHKTIIVDHSKPTCTPTDIYRLKGALPAVQPDVVRYKGFYNNGDNDSHRQHGQSSSHQQMFPHMEVSINGGNPNSWMVIYVYFIENLINMDDLGVTPISGNLHVVFADPITKCFLLTRRSSCMCSYVFHASIMKVEGTPKGHPPNMVL